MSLQYNAACADRSALRVLLSSSPRSTASAVNARVDAVFVLSVKTFHDRIRHIEAELARHGIAFEWIFEHDADELTDAQIEAVFAPSDLKRGHQSLVLKHLETWKRCVAHGYRRVLVFEDDAVLARDFERVFGAAMDEADRLDGPYMVYLGCGDNKYVEDARRSPTMLLAPGIELPATDATVLDRRAAELRLEYLKRHRITRPADWLMREADAEMGIAHYWLREPIVEQGSMSGMFTSVLDDKRTDRGRAWNWMRFRWDRWRRRTIGSTRPAAARFDAGEARAKVRFDIWAISVARFAAALTAIGSFVVSGFASGAAGIMCVSLFVAPSCWQRLKSAFWQPLGKAVLLFIAVLALAMLWSPVSLKPLLREWIAWRQFAWLFIALALFDDLASKRLFAAVFVVGCVAGAIASYIALPLGLSHGAGDILPGIVLRNHVTQGMALSAGALLAVVLAVQAAPHSRLRWGWIGAALLLASNVVFVAYGRSGYIVLGVLGLVAAIGLLRGRARKRGLVLLLVAGVGALALSPKIIDRFEQGWREVQEVKISPELTSMGMRVVIWEITGEIIRDAPLLGHGLASYPHEYRSRVSGRYQDWRARPSDDPHNQYLMLWAETGLLGLAAFVWLLYCALRQPVHGPFRVAGLALLLAWCITSLFSSHFQSFNEGHLIAILLGVCLARERDQPASIASTAARTSS
jgi:O-antigen ligase/GR25 family glycosyltransferase involved in LPS biosynthesis